MTVRPRPAAVLAAACLAAAALAAPVATPAAAATVPVAMPTAAAAVPHAASATPAGSPAGTPAAARTPRGTKGTGTRADVADSVLVRFRAGVSAAARRAVLGTRGTVEGAVGRTGLVRVRTAGAPEAAAAALRADPAVAAAAPNYRRRLAFTPDDTRYAIHQAGALGALRLPAAWDIERDAADQTVAVVDTGVAADHPELAGRVVAGCNTVGAGRDVDTCAAASTADEDPVAYVGGGHGTMVAGIVGAATHNGAGVAGVTAAAKIMPIKVFGPDPDFPDELGASDADIIEGVQWAADHGATVINLSLGGGAPGLLGEAMSYAVGKGAVVVAAAGNTGDEWAQYPAAFPDVLAVAATDNAARLTEFSTHGDWVDVAAPGFRIHSTFPGGGYESWSGTSFSAPLVAGVAALVRARGHDAAQTLARLRATARDAGPRGVDPFYGHGLVDAAAAVGAPALPPGPGVHEVTQPSMTNDGDGFPARAGAFRGSSVRATIGIEGDVDWYRRPVGAGRRVTVRVTPPAYDEASATNMDPVLAVYDQQLRLLKVADTWFDPTAAESATLTTPPGTTALYLAVSSYNGARDPRHYTLSAPTPGSAATPRPGAPAWVRDVTPVPYAVAQPATVTPRVLFNRAMRPSSITAATVRLRDGRTGAPVPATVTYEAGARRATVRPTAPLAATVPYQVEVGAVRDAAGATHTERVRTSFRVGAAAVTDPGLTTAPDGAGGHHATVSWAHPAGGDVARVVVRRAAGLTPPAYPTSGTGVFDSADLGDTDVTVPGLTGPAHTFSIFTVDAAGVYSAPVVTRLTHAAVTLRTATPTVTAGAPVTLTGGVTHGGGTPLAAAAVRLEFVPAGGGAATHVANLTAGPTGTLSYRVRPTANGTYRARYLGAGAGGRVVLPATGHRAVTVRVSVSAALNRAAVARGGTATLSGAVAPRHGGQSVRLEKRVGGRWATVTTRALSASSRYAFGIRAGAAGTAAYRVYHPGDGDHAANVSPVRTLEVS